ncbi:MAG: Ig-like domain-containing protein [Bryobacteraceae bacterium]
MIRAALPFFLVALLPAATRVEFDPRLPEVGPFPTDFLTIPDQTRPTGLRPNLPMPDCAAQPSDCSEIATINQLDGFNPNARLTVKFSAPIRTQTLREAIYYVWLDAVSPRAFALRPAGALTPINEVIYDPATHTAYAKPDEMLEQARRYLIVVTDAVQDASGAPVEPDPGFDACIERRLTAAYCTDLADAVVRARPLLAGRRIAGASLFTTLDPFAWFNRMEALAPLAPPRFQPRAEGAIASLRGVTGIALRQHTGGNDFQETALPVSAGLIAAAGLDRVAFGSFESPVLGSTATARVYFHAFLPATPPPDGGYPVLLAGHGLGDSRFGMPTVAGTASVQGYAVVAFSAFGHGYGPLSSLVLSRGDAPATVIAAPGRGLDLDGDGRIGATEGCLVAAPGAPIVFRDCIRQTAVDYRWFLNALAAGVDFDGDGRADLRSTGVHYLGQSLGGAYGSLVTALMPEVTAAVLNVPPGNQTMTLRLGPAFRNSVGMILLGARQPSLLNNGDEYEEDMPLRYEEVKLRTTPGAAAIQDLFERAEWINASAEAAVYAPHFKQATLGSNPVKRVLIQMAFGDRTVVNPSTSALVRAANLRERTVLYRHDLARAVAPSLDPNPHTFLIPLGSLEQQIIGLSALQQAIEYLLSERDEVPDANGLTAPAFRRTLFEIPEFLPETTNLTP